MFRTCIVDLSTELVVNVIEYETEQTGAPPGFPDTLLCVPSKDGQIGGEYINGKIVNPAPPAPLPPTAAENKATASAKLGETDWTSIADVADKALSNPYLMNQAEFIAYRSRIRAIAVNPPDGFIDWEVKPTAVWSSN